MSALTLADAKTFLNITDASQDASVQATIDAAEAAIEKRVGPLAARAVTARAQGYSNVLKLNTLPAISLTSVTPHGGSAMSLSSIDLDPAAGIVSYPSGGGSFPAAYYTVVYQAGRSTVPADLLQAVRLLVQHMWVSRRGSGTRPGSAPAEGLSNTLPGAVYTFPIRVEQILTPHLSMGFA